MGNRPCSEVRAVTSPWVSAPTTAELQGTPTLPISDSHRFANDSAMKEQIIEGRYVDRKKLLKVLEKLFLAKDYTVRASLTGAH